MPAHQIRPARVDDVDDILRLIIELATFEKEPESVVATPELLRKNLFETPYAHALLAFAEDNPRPVGLALYFFNYSTCVKAAFLEFILISSDGLAVLDYMHLEDLYVTPESRGSGLGKALFAELGKIAQEKNCARLDWSVLKWNQPAIDFYEKALKAKPMSEWMGMRLEEGGIEDLKELGA
ncbi:N-acetyltransferase domain-containing protein [Mycena indigotica]|uniref:N-acetyltransferase domain-containing protein n=1 Tax=Mycena indigotica TaxID=2126181 RepID=A0A8H6TCN5_9AGAR|nr:N-acetyltransferase domain-containing protein [Mycena indigotica]KAF7316370.1 N-acetyltransferase domain-containing protein [Mycena indigotica]